MPMNAYLILASVVFAISFAGIIINRKNVIILLMCIELALLAVNFNFLTFAQYLGAGAGEIFVFFVLTVAAAETAIGLAILVLYYRKNKTINVQAMNQLKG